MLNLIAHLSLFPQNFEGNLQVQKGIKDATIGESVIIIGDFNYPHIDLVNTYSPCDKETTFLDTIYDCALKQFINQLTRREATLE